MKLLQKAKHFASTAINNCRKKNPGYYECEYIKSVLDNMRIKVV